MMMAKRTSPKTGEKKEARKSPPKNTKTVSPAIEIVHNLVVQQQVAFLTHIEESNLAILATMWIDDPESDRMVPTFGFDNDQRCVDTNGHDVARSRLAKVGTFSGLQCGQEGDKPSEWVLARRLT